LPPGFEKRDLEIADGVYVGVTQTNRVLQSEIVIEKIFLARDVVYLNAACPYQVSSGSIAAAIAENPTTAVSARRKRFIGDSLEIFAHQANLIVSAAKPLPSLSSQFSTFGFLVSAMNVEN
jgi:D-ribose pyranose/furanose isomerase RbsD